MNALTQAPTLGEPLPHETQYTIAQWSIATFGPKTALKIAKRALVEFGEMIEALEEHEACTGSDVLRAELAKAAAVEAADVTIMLYSVANALKHDLMQLIDQKMVVNRARSWGTDPETGRTQHIEAKSAPTMKHLLEHVNIFKEPGSGLLMSPQRWYILSDSGSAYTGQGFQDVAAAREWAASPTCQRLYGGTLPLSQPSFLPAAGTELAGWDSEMDAANVLLGRDLFNFWYSNDPEQLAELNPELFITDKEKQA